MQRLRRAGHVPEDSHDKRDKRVLLAVSPPLLGDLLARRIAIAGVDGLEVVLLGQLREQQNEPGAADCRFDVVVTTGLPPARIEANAVLRLPAAKLAGTTGSLFTAGEFERVRVDRPSDVVDLVRDLCERRLPSDE